MNITGLQTFLGFILISALLYSHQETCTFWAFVFNFFQIFFDMHKMHLLITYIIVQIGTSDEIVFYYVAIIKSMIADPDRATNSINIYQIPVLYDQMIASLKRFDFVNFDFIKQVHTLWEFNGYHK